MQKIHFTKLNIHYKNSHQRLCRGEIAQNNKGHLWQTHSQPHTQWWNAESLSSKIRNKIKIPHLTTSIKQRIGSPSKSNQTRKRNKRYPMWKGSKTVTTWRQHDTIYRKHKSLNQKTIRINEFSKVAGYKVKYMEICCFLYTNNEISERERKKTILLKKKKKSKSPRWLSRLRIWHCHYHGYGCRCGRVQSPAWKFPHAAGMAKKKKKKI